jgi:hypothetical protein
MIVNIDDGDELLTMDQCLALMGRVWDLVERSALEEVAADAVAAGIPEADVAAMIGERAAALRESRPARLETARAMLEARCAAIH